MLKYQEIRSMRVSFLFAAAAAGLVLLASPVRMLAHHAFAAEFDANKPVHFTDATEYLLKLIAD